MNDRGQTVLDFAVGISVFLVVVAFVLTFVPGMVQPFQSSTQAETAAADRLAEQVAAGMLVEDVSEPYLLDAGCVSTFFALENSDGDPANDRDAYGDNDGVVRSDLFDITGSDLYTAGDCGFSVSDGVFERLATDTSDMNVRVSLVGDLDGDGTANLLCIDANEAGADTPDSGDTLVETTDPYASGTDCDMTGDDYDLAFETGNDPPADSSSVVTARRQVTVDGAFSNGRVDAALVVEVW
ncbi:DUF7287 family protein [Halosegnis marinus]|uniref:Uncharacterized protein n=1 Tax=Halosegnis marinus TaxID=3034023 RepID=A0ABD5ZS56_9EURY|nr:hypothetical protein [Halosegnis sp. DT85]